MVKGHHTGSAPHGQTEKEETVLKKIYPSLCGNNLTDDIFIMIFILTHYTWQSMRVFY